MNKYNLPAINDIYENVFLLDGDIDKDYKRVISLVRKMSLQELEEIVTELIYGQLTNKIMLVSKPLEVET